MKTTISNMTGRSGQNVANQFIITNYDENWNIISTIFQSYNSIIAKNTWWSIELDERYWDYSTTTGKYRNEFLWETKKETEAKIKNWEYILTNLN